MIHIEIKEPIWKNRSVGIAVDKIVGDICVSVLYKTASGGRLFPAKYFMKKETALAYPRQTVRRGTVVCIIPISDFEVVEDNNA